MDQTGQLDVNERGLKPAGRVAGLGGRAVAAFIDTFIPFPLLFFAGTIQAVRLHAVDNNGSFALTGAPAVLPMTLMFLGWMTYAVVAEYRFDGTIGKHIMGIAARAENMQPLTLRQALVRNLARVVDATGIGVIVALDSKRSRRIGDRLANTAVFELKKSGRMMGVLCGVVVFVVGILANWLALHFAQGRS